MLWKIQRFVFEYLNSYKCPCCKAKPSLLILVTGDDCSQTADQGFWEVLHPKDIRPEGSASHCAVVWKDSLYIVGGESYQRAKMLYTYDFNGMLKLQQSLLILIMFLREQVN